jgi:hypothetical protein
VCVVGEAGGVTELRKRPKAVTAAAGERFVELVAEGHTFTSAAKLLGYHRTAFTHAERGLVARDESFKAALAEAVEDSTQELEREAIRRAAEGWDEPVYRANGEVGVVRKYDSTMLIFLLKARRPDVYRDNVDVRHSGSVEVKSDLADALDRLTALLANARARDAVGGGAAVVSGELERAADQGARVAVGGVAGASESGRPAG